jgi:hypothetical protein
LATRYTVLFAQQSKNARDTAWSLWQCFSLFPLPKIIQSDNGTEFVNQVVKEMKDLLGIQHRLVVAYNPRANGSAERKVGATQVVLHKITNGDLSNWDLYIPAVNLALNSKLSASTKSSPASLLFSTPVTAFANYDRAESKLLTEPQLLERSAVLNRIVRPESALTFTNSQNRRVARVNARQNITPPIAVGKQVMVKDPTRSSKHQPYWFGPFTVVKQNRNGPYVLQDSDLSLFPREIPRDQLKLINSQEPIATDDIYTVEKIVNHRGVGAQQRFLIKWQGFPTSENTWEPPSNLLTCQKLLSAYWLDRRSEVKVDIPVAVSTNAPAAAVSPVVAPVPLVIQVPLVPPVASPVAGSDAVSAIPDPVRATTGRIVRAPNCSCSYL